MAVPFDSGRQSGQPGVAVLLRIERFGRPCRLQKRQSGVNEKRRSTRFRVNLVLFQLMSESKKKKVLTWLQSAVGRVREFAYAEPPAPPPERPRIGVALGGGFARGIAHLGVLRVLQEENIPVDYLAGTSAGALLAISYASGHTIPEIERQARATRFKDFGSWKLSWLGLASNQKLEHYPRKYLGVSTFEDLKIPLAIAATDLGTGKAVYFSHGPLGPALRASCAYPGMFVPVEIDGRMLVDGFLAAPVPVDAAREHWGRHRHRRVPRGRQ